MSILPSADWLAMRGAFERAGFRCERCGVPWGLEVHHLTYDNLGDESLEDLICLCRDCHRQLHGLVENVSHSHNQEPI